MNCADWCKSSKPFLHCIFVHGSIAHKAAAWLFSWPAQRIAFQLKFTRNLFFRQNDRFWLKWAIYEGKVNWKRGLSKIRFWQIRSPLMIWLACRLAGWHFCSHRWNFSPDRLLHLVLPKTFAPTYAMGSTKAFCSTINRTAPYIYILTDKWIQNIAILLHIYMYIFICLVFI